MIGRRSGRSRILTLARSGDWHSRTPGAYRAGAGRSRALAQAPARDVRCPNCGEPILLGVRVAYLPSSTVKCPAASGGAIVER